jgi:predicted Zn-ribbon and HTH transcriptional regulator
MVTNGVEPHFRTMILQCKDCGFDFVLSENEQLSYFRKGLINPVRCKECRQTRRQQGITGADGVK